MQDRSLLDELALGLCPGDSDSPDGTAWTCASPCRRCRSEAMGFLSQLATAARLEGLPRAGDWLDCVAAQQAQHQPDPQRTSNFPQI